MTMIGSLPKSKMNFVPWKFNTSPSLFLFCIDIISIIFYFHQDCFEKGRDSVIKKGKCKIAQQKHCKNTWIYLRILFNMGFSKK